jgi:3-hydroxybutyryl-CoA dehydratase
MSTKSYNLNEIEVGMSASYSQTIREEDVKRFAEISGDYNPLHLDENFATQSRYKKRIAHGLLPASFFSSLFGTKLPGAGCVYAAQDLIFKRPVYIGDTITAVATVEEVIIDKRMVIFKTTCSVGGKVCIAGNAKIFIPYD